MKRLPVKLSVYEQLSTKYIPNNPSDLSDIELVSELEYLYKILYEIRICVDLREELPSRLTYEYLIQEMNEKFDLMVDFAYHGNAFKIFMKHVLETVQSLDQNLYLCIHLYWL